MLDVRYLIWIICVCSILDNWCLITFIALWALWSKADCCQTEFHIKYSWFMVEHKNHWCKMIIFFQFSQFSLPIFFFQIVKGRVLQICLEKTQVSLFCCSLLSTFLSHIRHFTTPNGIKKKKLLLMQSYVAMLFYFFIKSKQYSCNNREKRG